MYRRLTPNIYIILYFTHIKKTDDTYKVFSFITSTTYTSLREPFYVLVYNSLYWSMPSKPSPNSKSWYFPGEPNTPTVLPSSPLLVPSLPVPSMSPSCPSLKVYQGQASLLCSVQLALTQDSEDAPFGWPCYFMLLTDPVKTLMTLLLLYLTNNPCPSISNHPTVCSTIIYDLTLIPRSVISTR